MGKSGESLGNSRQGEREFVSATEEFAVREPPRLSLQQANGAPFDGRCGKHPARAISAAERESGKQGLAIVHIPMRVQLQLYTRTQIHANN
jgi:hypothetical protein